MDEIEKINDDFVEAVENITDAKQRKARTVLKMTILKIVLALCVSVAVMFDILPMILGIAFIFIISIITVNERKI